MSNQNADFAARARRVKARSEPIGATLGATPRQRRAALDAGDDQPMMAAILRPQLAFVLGVIAMVAGRAFAMNSLMIEPSTEVLALSEGMCILVLLVGFGLLLGRSQFVAHGAMVVGASLAFLGEGFYMPLIPNLMEVIYSPEYVARVLLYSI